LQRPLLSVSTDSAQLFDYVLRLGDNDLILSQRLAEWCGHGPVLEEDLAQTNVALDLLGQAQLWLEYAGRVEEKGRDADQLAFLRDADDFRNILLVEQENDDYAHTIARQFYFDAWHFLLLEALYSSANQSIREISEKSLKEVRYHLDRSTGWVVRLGDGTEESHTRMERAINALWPFTGEMFEMDAVDTGMVEQGIGCDLRALRDPWLDQVSKTLTEATLKLPAECWMQRGGKRGIHSERLGYILAEMQFLQRAYPGAQW
jgi:ring-1,2-phenylacetyl-CoA epoxidase subunit PaaC